MSSSHDLNAITKMTGALSVHQLHVRANDINYAPFVTLNTSAGNSTLFYNVNLDIRHLGSHVLCRGGLALNHASANNASSTGWITLFSLARAASTARGQAEICPPMVTTAADQVLSYGTAFVVEGVASTAATQGEVGFTTSAAGLTTALAATTSIVGVKAAPVRMRYDTSDNNFVVELWVDPSTPIYSDNSATGVLIKVLITSLIWDGQPTTTPDSI